MKPLYELIEFNPYAVQYRYEAFEEVGTPLDRSTVVDSVGRLLKMVEALVGLRRE